MSDVMLHTSSDESVTCVSNIFIDDYMDQANGEYVKVYLYLLRSLGDSTLDFSIAGIADRFEYTQRDVLRALSYWEKKGLLRLEYTPDGSLSGICLLEPKQRSPHVSAAIHEQQQMALTMEMMSAVSLPPHSVDSFAGQPMRRQTASSAVGQSVKQHSVDPIAGQPMRQQPASSFAGQPMRQQTASLAQEPDHMYSLDEIQLLGKNMDVQEILFVTERYIGRPLSSTESNSVLYWYDYMRMSADLIEYLVEYCVENGHKSIHYMNKVAERWVNDGIRTVDDAKGSDSIFDKAYRAVTTNFGISGRNLTPPERKYLDTWTKQYGFSEDLIAEACKRTILKTGRGSFQYADSILSSWKKSKATSLEDVARLDSTHKQVVPFTGSKSTGSSQYAKDKFHNFVERDYDYNAIQAMLMKQQS